MKAQFIDEKTIEITPESELERKILTDAFWRKKVKYSARGENLDWFRFKFVDEKESQRECHDCGAKPGEQHMDGCDVERCTVCGGQRMCCDCEGHDKEKAKWTGEWPI